MNGTWIVAAREVVERRTVLLAALAAGLLPFASPLLPGVPGNQVAEARSALAWVLAAAFACGVALLGGAGAVGRDLVERRLGFDFARPLGASAIWAGRFAGVLVLVAGSMLLVLIPTALGGGLTPPFRTALPRALAAVAATVLLLVPLGHAAHVALRSRSRMLGVDLVCGTLVLLVVGVAARRLLDGFAPGLLVASAKLLAGAVIAALWLASAVHVVVGRTDPGRGHRALSLTLWLTLGATAAAFQAYTSWAVSATPADLVFASGSGAPRGDWAFVHGETADRGDFRPAFLVDTGAGRFLSLGGQPAGMFEGRFSSDGRRAAWLRLAGLRDPRVDVLAADLDAEEPRIRPTRISFPDPWVEMALSEDGTRLAAVHDGTLSVSELDSGKCLAAVRLPEAEAARTRSVPAFLDPDRVRIYRLRSTRLEVLELDVPARSSRKVFHLDLDVELPRMSWSATHRRILVGDLAGRRDVYLLDGEDGAVVARPGSSGAARRSFRWLADGDFVLAETDSSSARLVRYTADGEERGRVDLGAQAALFVGGEVASGVLAVTIAPPRDMLAGDAWTWLVDLDSGAILELERGLVPLAWLDPPEVNVPTSAAANLFGLRGSIVRLDPHTGKTHALTGS